MTEVRKSFPTQAVLAIATGVHLGDLDGMYRALNWMTGESLSTHHLSRVGCEAEKVILALHPHLKEAVKESEHINKDNWREWLDLWIDRYGETIEVVKLNADQHERIDPMSELAEKVSPDRIIVIET